MTSSMTGNDRMRSDVRAIVARHLTGARYTYNTWTSMGAPSDCLVEGFPYSGAYGKTDARTDMVLVHPSGSRARIMIRYQGGSGSVDEKFPFILENALVCPERDVVILLGGAGAKPEAVNWLRGAARARSAMAGSREVHVVTDLAELEVWVKSLAAGW